MASCTASRRVVHRCPTSSDRWHLDADCPRRGGQRAHSTEWDRGSRRLSGSLDHWNVRSWTGCVDVSKVNVHQSWATGMAHARTRLQATGLFSASELDYAALAASDEGITALKPRGVRVGAQLPGQGPRGVGA